jgi:hypothetical protein
VVVINVCADNLLIGEDFVRATPIHPCSQTVPTSPTTESVLSSRPPHWDRSMSVGIESQGEGKSCVGAECGSGELVTSCPLVVSF